MFLEYRLFTTELGLLVFSDMGLFVGTVCLRMQVNPANKEFKVWVST